MTDESATATISSNRPRTRQRAYKKPPTLELPDIDEDAAERKRVLNVLAQRRYRERKRLNRRKGESTCKDEGTSKAKAQTAQAYYTEISATIDDIIEVPAMSSSSSQSTIPCANITVPVTASSPGILAGLGLNLSPWDPLSDVVLTSVLPDTGALPDFLPDDNTGGEMVTQSQPGLPMTPGELECFTSFLDSSALSMSTSSSTASSSSPPKWDFPDSYNLPSLQLNLVRAVTRIAARINCNDTLWSLDCISPFNTGTATPADKLPVAWRPTPSQLTVPHHPIFDMLPWPGVRERAIMIMSLPDEMRPPNAQGPLAMVNFAYDVEDCAEGVRVNGEDPYEPDSWELGQVTFERWWFLFDKNIIETSNRWRRIRGAPPLLLKGANAGSISRASTATF
ncbi:hypothetical protein FZEAL_7180 [Fusarium zealandicum]|uniref:BZIP domain-containing protein n=1 Tax=Fusarium zealandicum TaxID=1053134 RepID=A0A8H4UH53_9HYPO|nr:hypothetical protein FZEAL_7180 [Fusarium zealandicum]